MTDRPPAVALLFDDSELGGQLRAALLERGARIVHEGGVSGFSRSVLQRVGADVLVVNLDDNADDALDSLYEVIDGDQPRVVFNDAQASRALAGWDRARWARHLAVKVLAIGDIDPPRPEDTRAVDQVEEFSPVQAEPAFVMPGSPAQADNDEPPMAIEEPAVTSPSASPEDMSLSMPDMQLQPEPESQQEPQAEPPLHSMVEPEAHLQAEPLPGTQPDWLAPAEPEPEHQNTLPSVPVQAAVESLDDEHAAGDSESLAAELEALLASGDLPDDDEVTGPGLRFVGDDEPPALHDGDFSLPQPATAASNVYEVPSLGVPAVPAAPGDLQLSAMIDPSLATIPAAAAEPVIAVAAPAAKAPESWALLDDDAAPVTSSVADKPNPADFGIEKLSAAEFLAPDAGSGAEHFEPTMSLELVSMEEAIAPQAYVPEHEMLLDELGSALSRLVLLGAAVDGVASVCEFLAALPANTRLAFLHTQHLGGQSDSALVERFSAGCALPVRLADGATRVKAGEVLLVPAGQQVRLRRDGSIELQALAGEQAVEPSIDASLTMAASAFGRDALAIVFAGRGNDAVAGAQAIHDRGGEVWVESSSGEHFADMVSGIFAERLVSFSGTPHELAAHLSEVFS